MNLPQALKRARKKLEPSEVSFVIPRVPTSLNKMLHMHWAKRSREQKLWDEEVFVSLPIEARSGFRVDAEKRAAQVEIRVIWAKRRLDPDGLAGAMKPIIDALRHSGLIYNDSPKWMTLVPSQGLVKQAGGHPRTEILIKKALQ